MKKMKNEENLRVNKIKQLLDILPQAYQKLPVRFFAHVTRGPTRNDTCFFSDSLCNVLFVQ